MNRGIPAVAAAVVGVWAATAGALDVYVKPGPSGNGSDQSTWFISWIAEEAGGTGTGTENDPYDCLMKACYSVWGVAGNHNIILKPGTYTRRNIGHIPGQGDTRAAGTLAFNIGAGPVSTAPSFDSITLKPYSPDPNSVTIHAEWLNDPENGTFGLRYQSIGTQKRGLFGFWAQLTDPAKTWTIKDINITLGPGRFLWGSHVSVAVWRPTFDHVKLIMQGDATWGNAGLFWSHVPEAGITNSKLTFTNSTIYYQYGANDRFYAGATRGNSSSDRNWLPENFVDGSGSSRIYRSTTSYGTAYSLKTILNGDGCGIWQTHVNDNQVTLFENAGTNAPAGEQPPANRMFLKNFLTTEPLADPEIHMTGSGDPIADGQTPPEVADGTAFGSTAGTITKTFTVYNTVDDSTLSLGPWTVTGSGFTFVGTPPPSIANIGSATFEVRFSSSGQGLVNGSVSVANNDPDENPYNFDISATGLAAPGLVITTPADKSIAFGDQLVGGTYGPQTITVQNIGTVSGTVTPAKSGANPADFTIIGGMKTIPAGESRSWTVTFRTTEYGARSVSVNFAAAQGGASDSCAVSGNGSVPDPGANPYKWVNPNRASGGTGTFEDPYASLQQAYDAVWATAGDHTIMLLPGTCDGNNISTTTGGYILKNGPPTATYNSITLSSWYLPEYTVIAFDPVTAGSSPYWSNPGTVNGLWRFNFGAFSASPHPLLLVKDLKITVASGGVLFGHQGTDTRAHNVEFQDVSIYFNYGGNGPSAIFAEDSTQTPITSTSIRFKDSNLYWGSADVYVARTWQALTMPTAFVDGQESSMVYVWSGGAYQLKKDLVGDGCKIWYSYRNADVVTLNHQENGEAGVNVFFKNFLARKPLTGCLITVQ